MKNKKAFSLIEVLIATFILSVSIMILSVALKQFFTYKNKLEKYQLIYITTLSLLDKISSEDLSKDSSGEGKLNGLKYRYKATIIDRKRNIINAISEYDNNSVDYGIFEILLFEINLSVGNKKFIFYKTQYKKLSGYQFQ